MNAHRIWMLGSLLLSAVILAGSYFIGVAPMVQAAAQADRDRADVEILNRSHEVALADLTARFATIDDLRGELAGTRTALPSSAGLPGFLGDLSAASASAGTIITNVAVSDGLFYVPAEVAPEEQSAPSESAATAAGTDEPATQTSAAIAPANQEPAAPSGVLNAQLVTPENFISIPIDVSVDGSLEQVMAFVGTIQSNSRIYLVTGLTVSLDESTGIFTADVSGFAYTLLQSGSIAPGDPIDPEVASTAELN